MTPAERTRAWRLANPRRDAAARAARRARDPEGWKAMRQGISARYEANNGDAIKERRRARLARLKAAAIAAYGGHCCCPGCHVVHAELMTIDHVNGGGAQHRKAVGRGSREFYRWLEKHGYPAGFQALCGSCNLAKSDRAKCPLAGQPH